MNFYSIALFIHVVAALGFFIALGLEWIGLRQMRSDPSLTKVREWMQILGSTRKLGMASMITIIIAGLYMMATAWGLAAWIGVALGSIVLLIILAMALTGPQMAALGQALAAGHGPGSPTLQQLTHHPLLWISMQTRLAIGLGIIFLMTVKPGLLVSLLAIGVALVLGLASSLPVTRHEQVQEGTAR